MDLSWLFKREEESQGQAGVATTATALDKWKSSLREYVLRA